LHGDLLGPAWILKGTYGVVVASLSKIIAGFLGFGLLVGNCNALADEVAIVYFIPFSVETYVPVTKETVMSHAFEKWTLSSKREVSQLKELLDDGEESSFNDERVRVVIRFDNEMYFIDAEGVVLHGKKDVRLDTKKFIEFRDSLLPSELEIFSK
jgi:hypothetical protein